MKNKIMFLKKAIVMMGFAALSTSAIAQGGPSLKVGDDAPELKYSKWIKGTPVTSYEKDRMYVVEFWATWCGPCKAAMPHLSALAKKYKDNATFIGMNIWEKTGDKPYESSLPSVVKYVNSVGDNMAYNVAADNNEQFMVNKWMLPAGQQGIPATFLLKDGKVLWIGHPMAVDSIMNLVVTGKYDIDAQKKQFESEKVRREAMMAKFAVLKPMQEAYKAKDYDKALGLLNTIDTSDMMIKMQVNHYRFSILLDQGKEKEALTFAKAWVKENKGIVGTIAGGLLAKDKLSKDAYLYAVEMCKMALEEEGIVKPLVYHAMSQGYVKAGDIKSAIASEETAIQSAKDALKEGKFVGSVMESTVTDFEASLADLKKKG